MTLLEVEISSCGYRNGFQLQDINFNVDRGEILLIAGRSGSGKTTLVRAITGTLETAGGFIEGKVYLAGRRLEDLSAEEIFRSITYIPQEPWYAFIGHTVYAEIYQLLSLIGVGCTGINVNTLGITKLLNRLTYTLSAGEIQRVLWTESILKESKLMVLDEPIVYLDQEARSEVILLVKKALSRGVGIIIVDHNPDFWGPLQPNLMYLEDGRVSYYGKWSYETLKSRNVSPMRVSRSNVGTFIQFKNVWFKYPGGDFVLKNLNMTFERGVVTCIMGPNGSGKSTILKLAAGVLKPTRGSITRAGSSIYIPENPLLYFSMPTPREELLVSAKGDEHRVLDTAERFNISRVLDKPLAKLSSGERRRLAIASAYLAGFEGYFIDEPTGGLDYDTSVTILNCLYDLVEEKKAVVVATHDDRFLNMMDTYVNLRRGGD